MATNLENISVEDLKRAVALRERIEELQRELAGILGGSAAPAKGRRGPRFMSAEARARIAEAQRRRWAKHRKSAVATKPKSRRRMSAQARARIASAARARWAKVKAKGQRTLAG